MIKICISGRYGEGSLGDELALVSIVDTIRKQDPEAQITVFSSSPQQTSEEFGVESVDCDNWDLLKQKLAVSDILICGGGHLLTEENDQKDLKYYLKVIRAAEHKGVMVVIFNQKIVPFSNGRTGKAVAGVLKKARKITVSDRESAEYLGKLGLRRGRIHVVSNPVLALKDLEEEWKVFEIGGNSPEVISDDNAAYGDREMEIEIRIVDSSEKTVATDNSLNRNVVSLKPNLWKQDDKKLCGFMVSPHSDLPVTQIIAMADYMAENGYRVVYLPLSYPRDVKLYNHMLATMNSRGHIVDGKISFRSLVTAIGTLDFVFTTELYGMMLATVAHKPFASFCCDEASLEFVQSLGFTPTGNLMNYNYEEFIANFKSLIKNTDNFWTGAEEAVDSIGEEAVYGQEQITMVMESIQRRKNRVEALKEQKNVEKNTAADKSSDITENEAPAGDDVAITDEPIDFSELPEADDTDEVEKSGNDDDEVSYDKPEKKFSFNSLFKGGSKKSGK